MAYLEAVSVFANIECYPKLGYPLLISSAFWELNSMVYGDGDGVNMRALCHGLDIVAHVSFSSRKCCRFLA